MKRTIRQLIRIAYKDVDPDSSPDSPGQKEAYSRLIDLVCGEYLCCEDEAERLINTMGGW